MIAMSTTYNHFMVGAIVTAVATDLPTIGKVAVGAGLVVGHFALDLIPHQHAHDLYRWRESWGTKIGILADAVLSFTVFLWALLHTAQPILLVAYCSAANLVDLDVFTKRGRIHDWHVLMHAGWQGLSKTELWVWEMAQTALLISAYISLY